MDIRSFTTQQTYFKLTFPDFPRHGKWDFPDDDRFWFLQAYNQILRYIFIKFLQNDPCVCISFLIIGLQRITGEPENGRQAGTQRPHPLVHSPEVHHAQGGAEAKIGNWECNPHPRCEWQEPSSWSHDGCLHHGLREQGAGSRSRSGRKLEAGIRVRSCGARCRHHSLTARLTAFPCISLYLVFTNPSCFYLRKPYSLVQCSKIFKSAPRLFFQELLSSSFLILHSCPNGSGLLPWTLCASPNSNVFSNIFSCVELFLFFFLAKKEQTMKSSKTFETRDVFAFEAILNFPGRKKKTATSLNFVKLT